MSARKIFEHLDPQAIKYTPSTTGRVWRPSFITIEEKNYHILSEIAAGKYGEVGEIDETNLIRKKGDLTKDDYPKIKKEIFFHQKCYGENSIVAKYFLESKEEKKEVFTEKIEEQIKEDEGNITYRLIRKNINGTTLDSKLCEYKGNKKKILLLYMVPWRDSKS